MRLRLPLLGNFEFGRPQQFAALMLLALAAQSLWLARTPGFDPQADAIIRRALDLRFHLAQTSASSPASPQLPTTGILIARVEEALMPSQKFLARLAQTPHLFALWFRIPFVLFGLWLGAALWWVSRRLYNNSGAYVALALYCSSPLVLRMSSQINSDVVAAWGLFGSVYTAIGVAHTLYAPPKKWPPRVVLLGVAFGVTAAANYVAFPLALILATIFMLYLAPGRRIVSLAILLIAIIIAVGIICAWYGFALPPSFSFTLDLRSEGFLDLWRNSGISFLLLLAAGLIIFAVWRRPKYFGNSAPLIVALLLLACGESFLWSLPFLFVLIGGIFADVFETGELGASAWHARAQSEGEAAAGVTEPSKRSYRDLAIVSVAGLIAAQEVLSLLLMRTSP